MLSSPISDLLELMLPKIFVLMLPSLLIGDERTLAINKMRIPPI